MKLRVHISSVPGPEGLAFIQAELDPRVELSWGEEMPDGVQILVDGRASPEQLANNPLLHTVIIPWAGIPGHIPDLMAGYPHIKVYNLHHNAAPVAETAVALLLAAAKFVVPYDRELRRGDWSRRYAPSNNMLLDGKTALILGYGAIGRRVARACQGLGMALLAVRRRAGAVEQGVAIHRRDALPKLLPLADAVVVTLPLTAETHGFLGAEELALLPSGAILVNIGRGPVIDQRALYEALRSGQLRAAGLDVWYNYPQDEASRSHTPPGDYPFYELDNVVMSPHRSGSSDGTEMLRLGHLARLINDLAYGREPDSRVDLVAGY